MNLIRSTAKAPLPKLCLSLIKWVVYYHPKIQFSLSISLVLCTNLFVVAVEPHIGETNIHYEVRKNEHLETDKSSAVHKHIHSNAICQQSSSDHYFSVLANSKYAIRLKEGLHILWEKPELNKQVKCDRCCVKTGSF